MKIGFILLRAATLSLPFVVALPAQAQSRPLPTLKEVVVTATRLEQPITDVVADVSIIDRGDIERMGVSSVAQILARLPGLQTVNFGDASRVYIRGADSRMTALYVDGVRVDTQDGVVSLGGGVPWELIPLSQIDRIEVLRGPASAVYGSDAMGGVVQIFTRRAEDGQITPSMEIGAGSRNLWRANAGLQGVRSGWDFALGVAQEDSDGFNTRPDLVHSPDHEAYSQRSASLRLGYQLGVQQHVGVSGLASELASRYVPWGGGVDYTAKGNLKTAAVDWAAQWTPDYATRVVWASSNVAKQDDAPNDYQTSLQSALWENSLKLAGGTLTAVAEQKNDAFDARPSAFDPAFRGERTQSAMAIGYGINAGPHSLQVNVRSDQDSLFGDYQTGVVAYALGLAPHWRATVSTGTAFRAPTLEQIFGQYGSARLAPETNHSSEAGINYSNGASSFKVVAYRNSVVDMISSSASLTSCTAGFFCYYNVGQATIQGATLSGATRLAGFDLTGSLDFLDARDSVTDKFLNLRARRSMTVGLDRRVGSWQLGAELQAVDARFDDAANTKILPGYALLNLNANSQVGREWRLVARIDNVNDASYQQVKDYATPGRTLYVGLIWQSAR